MVQRTGKGEPRRREKEAGGREGPNVGLMWRRKGTALTKVRKQRSKLGGVKRFFLHSVGGGVQAKANPSTWGRR